MSYDQESKLYSESPEVFAFVSFSLDSSVLNHSRAIYNLLDFLGDIGGLYDCLKLIAWPLISVFGSGAMTNRLNSKVFYTEP